MFSLSNLLAVIVSAVLFMGASAAHARGSVLINKRSLRARMNRLIKRGRLRLGRRLRGPTLGISARALRKAKQTEQGFNGFNYGTNAKSFVVGKRRGSKLVVTTAKAYHYVQGSEPEPLRFVARSGQSGTVLGRGFLQAGKITWTRSKNERGKDTPSERNAARKKARSARKR